MHVADSPMAHRPRIIVALPDATESDTVAEWLTANRFEPVQRPDPSGAAGEMHRRAFDLLVADDTFAIRDDLFTLSRQRNPLTPVVVIGNGADTELPFAVSRHVMHVPRPVERPIVLCTVSLAILEGRPNRRSERRTANRLEAIVNGVPSHIIDVSHHGVQLQIPGTALSALPPHFSVRVPLMGVSIAVQRVWARATTNLAAPGIACGAVLAANRAATEQQWRGFVDTLPDGAGPAK
jgi:hypothetical protein